MARTWTSRLVNFQNFTVATGSVLNAATFIDDLPDFVKMQMRTQISITNNDSSRQLFIGHNDATSASGSYTDVINASQKVAFPFGADVQVFVTGTSGSTSQDITIAQYE